MVTANQGSNRCQYFSLWLDPTGVQTTDLPHLEQMLYPLTDRGGSRSTDKQTKTKTNGKK